MGDRMGQVDFLENGLFKYDSVAERCLDYTNIEILKRGSWSPLLKANRRRFTGSVPETIRIYDNRNHYYVISIPKSGQLELGIDVERLPAEGVSIIKEPSYPGYTLVNEQEWTSENNVYHFRIRRFENDAGQVVYQHTLLRQEHSVENYLHEFWTAPNDAPINDAFVSNNGHVLFLRVGLTRHGTTGEMVEFAALMALSYDGSVTGGLYLPIDRLFRSYADAQNADLSGLSVEYESPGSQIDFEGAAVMRNARESYTWNLPNGNLERFYIGQLMPGVAYGIYWTREPLALSSKYFADQS